MNKEGVGGPSGSDTDDSVVLLETRVRSVTLSGSTELILFHINR